MIINSTAEILAYKVLNRNINNIWVDWDVDMLVAGFDTENLRILAGESEPINQFYAQELVNKIFNELNIDYANQEQVIINYAIYLIEKSQNEEIDRFNVLDILKNICIELEYPKYLYNFYLLYFAKDDLNYTEEQYHWHKNHLNRKNIDNFIDDYFDKWLQSQKSIKSF